MNKLIKSLLFVLVGLLLNQVLFAFQPEPVPVTVKPLKELVFHPVKKAPAQVVTLQNSLLSSELTALIETVYVQIGDRVTKDQLLIKLECDDFKLSKEHLILEKHVLSEEQKFAIYQYERSKKLIKSKSVSQEAHRRLATEVTKMVAQMKLLDSKIKRAEKDILRCQIKAPFSGVIAQRLVSEGEHVTSHSPLFRLVDIDNLEVEVQVPIVLVNSLDYSALNFVFHNKSYPLKIRAVIPGIETRARHQKVRLSFLKEKTLPDAYGMVEITLRAEYIPANYLVTRGSQVGVFIIDENSEDRNLKVQFHVIDKALTGRAAIVDLPANTQVIISGRNALVNGQNVLIQNP